MFHSFLFACAVLPIPHPLYLPLTRFISPLIARFPPSAPIYPPPDQTTQSAKAAKSVGFLETGSASSRGHASNPNYDKDPEGTSLQAVKGSEMGNAKNTKKETDGALDGVSTGGVGASSNTEGVVNPNFDAMVKLEDDSADAEGASQAVEQAQKENKKQVGILQTLRVAMIKGVLHSKKKKDSEADAGGDNSARGIKFCLNVAVLFAGPAPMPHVNLIASFGLSLVEGLSAGVAEMLGKKTNRIKKKMEAMTKPEDKGVVEAEDALLEYAKSVHEGDFVAKNKVKDPKSGFSALFQSNSNLFQANSGPVTDMVKQQLKAIQKDSSKSPAVVTEAGDKLKQLSKLKKAVSKATWQLRKAMAKHMVKTAKSTVFVMVCQKASDMLTMMSDGISSIVGRSGAEMPSAEDVKNAAADNNAKDAEDEEGGGVTFLELGEGRRTAVAARGALRARQAWGSSIELPKTVPWYKNAKGVAKRGAAGDVVVKTPKDGAKYALEDMLTVQWDQTSLDSISADGKQCKSTSIQLMSQNSLGANRLHGSWDVNMTDACATRKDCSWKWQVQSSSRQFKGKEIFQPIVQRSDYFILVWCDGAMRTEYPALLSRPNEFSIKDRAGNGHKNDAKGSACVRSLSLSVALAPSVVWPIGVDFSLLDCGRSLFEKVKGLMMKLFRGKKKISADDSANAKEMSGGDKEGGNKPDPSTANNIVVSQITGVESRTEGADDGILDAEKTKDCRRLDLYGSVLLDISVAMPLLTVIKQAKIYADLARQAYTIYKQSRKLAAGGATKTDFSKCLDAVLAKAEYRTKGVKLTSKDKVLQRFLGNIKGTGNPDTKPMQNSMEGPLTTENLKELLEKNAGLFSKKPEHKHTPRAIKEAFTNCLPSSQLKVLAMSTASNLKTVLTRDLMSEGADAVTFATGALSFTMAAHLGPIVDAAKCVYHLTKDVCTRAIAKIFGAGPCDMACAPLTPKQFASGALNPCLALLNVTQDSLNPSRPRLPVCISRNTGDGQAKGKSDAFAHAAAHGKCLMCAKAQDTCKASIDCSTGVCHGGKCLMVNLDAGTECMRNSQCRSYVCQRTLSEYLRSAPGSCAILKPGRCQGVFAGMGGCGCGKHAECKSKANTPCRGLYSIVGMVLSRGACVGTAPPKLNAGAAAETDPLGLDG